MQRMKVLFAALTALCALSGMLATAASASVGPTLLFPLCERERTECGPTVLINIQPTPGDVHLAWTIPSELQSESARIPSTLVLLELTLLEERGSLGGIYLAKFYHTELTSTREACETEGAAERGEVEVGERNKSERVRVVYLKIGSPLEVGVLFEVAALKVLCNGGRVEVRVKGEDLGSLDPLNTEIRAGAGTIRGGVTCKAIGKPSKTTYINGEGRSATASLRVTAGGLSEPGCELVGTTETTEASLLANKMIELMG
jgi:hypothetical protein